MAKVITMKALKSFLLAMCVVSIMSCASEPGAKGPMTSDKFKSVKPFTTATYDAVWENDGGAKVTIRGPVAYFGVISSEFPYRILPVDGPASGGAVLDITHHPELVERYKKADAEGKTLWIALSGIMEQYVTENRYNPETMPDTILTKSRTLGYDLTEPVIFVTPSEDRP